MADVSPEAGDTSDVEARIERRLLREEPLDPTVPLSFPVRAFAAGFGVIFIVMGVWMWSMAIAALFGSAGGAIAAMGWTARISLAAAPILGVWMLRSAFSGRDLLQERQQWRQIEARDRSED